MVRPDTGSSSSGTAEARRLPRIALVAASLEIVGGQSIEADLLAKALRRESYDVIQIAVNPRLPRGLQWVRRVRAARTLLNLAFYLPSLIRLARVDVVHVFSASYWSFLLAPVPAMLVGRLLGKQVILHYHSGEAADHLASWGVLIQPWFRLAHEIVVPSQYLAEVFDEAGYSTKVISNFIQLSDFPYRERPAIAPKLLSTRNLEPHYAVGTVVTAFALIKQRYPAAILTVAGQGREGAILRDLARSAGGDSIRFLGQVAPGRIPALLDEADVFLNASVVDNQPLSIIEAFASGLPVVTTSTGAIAEMVRDGRTARLVRSDDPQAIADGVFELLADANRAVAISRRARTESERYSWEGVRGSWARIYGWARLTNPERPAPVAVANSGALVP